jgi:hypothetical protein
MRPTLRAADLARREHDTAGLARAALGLHMIGSRIWRPPDELVSVLSEALDAVGPGGADEVLDATARQQIRARLADLDEEIAEAENWSDPERAARARAERDALVREAAAAAGIGRRARRLGDQSERARKTVTARIRDVNRIEQVHPALGAHLKASVTTGTYCAYSPPTPVAWRR